MRKKWAGARKMSRAIIVALLLTSLVVTSSLIKPEGDLAYEYSIRRRREIKESAIQGVIEDIKLAEEKKEKERIEAEKLAEEEKIKSKPLYGKIICLDPGHGITDKKVREKVSPSSQETKAGNVSGTKGVRTGISEQKLNLDIALKLKESLEKEGAIIFLTRDSEYSDLTNIDRANFANDKGADLQIRIHADGIDNPDVRGCSVLVPDDSSLPREIVELSRRAGEEVLKAYVEKTGFKNRGIIKRKDMTGFNWSKLPVILIEMGFMSNAKDDELMSDPVFQDRMVDGISQGLKNFFLDNKD